MILKTQSLFLEKEFSLLLYLVSIVLGKRYIISIRDDQVERVWVCPLQCIGERKVLTQPYYQTRISFIWAVANPPAYKYRKHISTLCIGTIKPFSGKLYLSALHMYNVQYTSAPKSMNIPISLPRQMHIEERKVI